MVAEPPGIDIRAHLKCLVARARAIYQQQNILTIE